MHEAAAKESAVKPILTTQDLTLRPLCLADAAWFGRYAGEAEVARMTGSITTPMPELAAEFWVMRKCARREQGLAYPYVIEHGGVRIGMVDLFKSTQDAVFEIGYSMMPQYWGMGYTQQACQAVIEQARASLGVTRITAAVFVDNPASIHLLRKLGFSALRTHEQWFSMGRMEKAQGVTLCLALS